MLVDINGSANVSLAIIQTSEAEFLAVSGSVGALWFKTVAC